MICRRVSVFLFSITLVFALGCSGSTGRAKTYPVTGSVKHNGKAVEGATVMFQIMDGKESAIGSTDANGEFSLSTFSPSDGAVAGQYKVAISKYASPPAESKQLVQGQIQSGDLGNSYAPPAGKEGGSSDGAPKNLLPAKYANDQTSALRATVASSGTNRFDFDLK